MRPCGVARVGYIRVYPGTPESHRSYCSYRSYRSYRSTNVSSVASGGHAKRTGV